MKIKCPKIFCDGHFQTDQVITLEHGRIQSIAPATSTETIDLDLHADTYTVPGLLDLHIHGANGKDVMDATPKALYTISQSLAEEGVTGFLATTMTEAIPKIEKALEAISQFKETAGADILGVHLEGPFLSQKYMGAQCGEFILDPQIELLEKWQRLSGNKIKLLTLAPELPNADAFIKAACKMGIVISIGHTAATFAESKSAADAGARYATHLFNAMSGVHHRTPGAAAFILSDNRINAELVADGHHVVPEMLKFAVQCKGLSHLSLVTDAMRAKCLKNGEYDLGGQPVVVADGAVRLKKNGVLAGSVLRLNGALRNFIQLTGESLESCIPMVTSTPARTLGMEDQIGHLAPSLKANLVILNHNLDVLYTIRDGAIIYQRS